MAGALRKTMVYLGLAEEDERYQAYDAVAGPDPDLEEDDVDAQGTDDDDRVDQRLAGRASGRAGDRFERSSGAEVEHVERAFDRPGDRSDRPGGDRVQRRAAVTPIGRATVTRVVTAPAELHRICTIHPRTYNEAKTIGESFRGGTPVIMNLTDMDDSDAKRLVDFAAGLVFGLHGSIEKVTGKVFLLSPSTVEVAPADKPRAVPERTFFNQS